jgi:hypothetical protein
MATTPRKTFPELQALSAPVVDSDLLAVYRSPGPAKRTTASVLGTYVNTVIGTPFTRTLLDDADAATARTTLAAVGTADLAASTGAALIGTIGTGTGAVLRTVQDRLRDVVSVFDFIPVNLHSGIKAGTETTLLTTYLQAAIDSGAAKIIFPAGKYYTGSLTLPDWIELEGIGYTPTIGGDDRPVELRFGLASGAGLTCGSNPKISNIWLQNGAPASYNEGTKTLSGTTAQAILLTENVTLEEVGFSQWAECIRTGANTFYATLTRPHFNRCTRGIHSPSVSPFDITIFGPHSTDTNIFLSGATTAYARNTKVFGGSIEGYERVAEHFQDIAFFGTYFETIPERTNVFAIEPGLNGSAVTLVGCLIYMNHTARFVNMSTLTGVSLVSHGNVWDGVGQASGICLFLPSTGSVSAAGDRFGTGHDNSTVYVDSVVNAAKFNISIPVLPAGNSQAAYSGVTFLAGLASMQVLTAAPAAPFSGLVVTADGSTWDPLEYADARPYLVIWQSDRWTAVGGMRRALNQAAIATADATDLATAITLANATKAALNTLLSGLKTSNAMVQD